MRKLNFEATVWGQIFAKKEGSISRMWKKLDNNAEFEEATVWVQIFACLKNKKERSEGRKERSLETRIQFPRGVEGKMKYLIAEEEELEGKVK